MAHAVPYYEYSLYTVLALLSFFPPFTFTYYSYCCIPMLSRCHRDRIFWGHFCAKKREREGNIDMKVGNVEGISPKAYSTLWYIR